MYKFSISRLILAAALAGLAVLAGCSGNDPVDKRLVGTWITVMGQWTLTFEPGIDGTYRTTFSGPLAPPAETGDIKAHDGLWETVTAAGEKHKGTYFFPADNTLVLQSDKGALTWQRTPASATAAAPPPPGALPAIPGQGRTIEADWPMQGLPELSRNMLAQARQHYPDSILTGIDATLLQANSPVVNNVDTPAGRVDLVLTFCSPQQQMSFVIRPNADGGTPAGDNPADCQTSQAIENFPELTVATQQARDRGMQADYPREARLKNRTRGVPGEDIFGVAWQIFSTQRSDRTYLIPAQPSTDDSVRVVDACRLITSQEAQAALQKPVHSVTPDTAQPHTWSCLYQVGSNAQQQLGITIDENPARNAHAFMDRQRRNGRRAVSGLGDEAYLFDSPAGFAQLDVRLGDTLMQLSLSGPTSGREQTITRLARQAVARVASGEAIGADEAPDARLVGNWNIVHRNLRLALEVRPDQSLRLSTADNDTAVVSTEENRWKAVDRARRAVRSGTLQWLNADSFRTGGDIEARWQRVPADRPMAGIANDLLTGTNLEAAYPVESTPWPNMPLDARLPGLWQGEGQTGQQKVTLLWRIRADAPSTLVTIRSGKGYVERVDRWQRVILKFSGELEKLGRDTRLDLHDGAVVTGFTGDNVMHMQMHDLARLDWTRAGAAAVPATQHTAGSQTSPASGSVAGAPGAADSKPASTGRPSISETASKVGHKAADIVGDTAKSVGGFLQGIFGKDSSRSNRQPADDTADP